jgi:hypothetical protein
MLTRVPPLAPGHCLISSALTSAPRPPACAPAGWSYPRSGRTSGLPLRGRLPAQCHRRPRRVVQMATNTEPGIRRQIQGRSVFRAGPCGDQVFGSAGRQMTTVAARQPQKPRHSCVSSLRRPPPADGPRRPAPDPRDSAERAGQLPAAREQVLRPAGSDQHRRRPAGIPGHHRQHRQLRALAELPELRLRLDGREPEAAPALSGPSQGLVRPAGSGGRHAGRSPATRPLGVRIERDRHPDQHPARRTPQELDPAPMSGCGAAG